MSSEFSKRFIKKLPASSTNPVYKLTLAYNFVHTHLAHLIDREFEIATSADATNWWQGSIAPRRNKNRSEYTLQGWRLFAEAHGVQPGDQVSFELVSPTRMVVKLMTTEEAKQVDLAPSTSANLDDTRSGDSPAPEVHDLDLLENLQQEQSAERVVEAMRGNSPFRAARSMESSFQQANSEDLPDAQRIREFLSTGPAAARPPSFLPSTYGAQASLSSEGQKMHLESPRTLAQSAPKESGYYTPPVQTRAPSGPPFLRQINANAGTETNEAHLLGGIPFKRKSMAQYPAGSQQMQNEILELRTTIQAQQANLHAYEAKARRAEYEASQVKLFYSELHVSMHKQTRHVIHAGECLERLIQRLSSPQFLAGVDQNTSDNLVVLQSELFKQLHSLKACLLSLLSLEV